MKIETQRMEQQIQFVLEIDQLKQICRQSYLIDGNRRENTAEHSWHVALMSIILAEYAAAPPDRFRVVKMLMIHDLIEIDAGDTYCYDEMANQTKAEREQTAADRIFSILPPDQAIEFRELWEEFETGTTSEARFARALDRLMPLLHNFHTGWRSWQEHGITRPQVIRRCEKIQEGSERLWQLALSVIDTAVRRGYLAAG